MDIRVELATQADVEAMAALQTVVIQVNGPGFEKLWPPSTVTPEAIHRFYTKSYTAALADPSSILVKATSAEGVLVGHGKAVFIPSESERNPSPKGNCCPVGGDIDLCMQIAEDGSRMKDKIAKGRPYYILTGIITHPAYYRRGVASQLCRFFLDEGDKRGLPCILTGSPDGTPLYEKLGFVEKEEVIWRMKDGFVIRVEPVMIREPGSQS